MGSRDGSHSVSPARRKQLQDFKQRTKDRKVVYRQIAALGLPDQEMHGWKKAFHRIQHRDAETLFGGRA